MSTTRPRLLWLTQGHSPKLPSQRLRVLEIMPLLANAFDQKTMPTPTTLRALWQIRQRIREADLVVLQKELVSRPVLWLLRRLARRLVYDFDDAVHLRLLADGSCRPSRKRAARFAAICRQVDLCIAGNPVLEAAARDAGARRIAVIPTGVDLPVTTGMAAPAGPVRLGWIGTNVNLPYIEAMEPLFLQLQQEGLEFVLRVMAGKPPAFPHFAALEFVPWSVEAEASFLASLDIGLMPLADNPHTRGKCAYKALQYMSQGKPVVVSDVGVNAAWTVGAGFATRDDDELAAALRRLLADPSLRTQMGACGRARVTTEFARPVCAAAVQQQLLALFADKDLR
jgi:glycosyltransferase involved in cell wall biosynthesis